MDIKARVLPGNNYGGATSGQIITVDEEELRRVPWALERLLDEGESFKTNKSSSPIADLPPGLPEDIGESAVASDLAASGLPDPHAPDWDDEPSTGSHGSRAPTTKKKK